MFYIGKHRIEGRVLLAPMAGITDLPFRRLCRRFGAALAVAEMSSSNLELKDTRKSSQRCRFDNEPGPRVAQIAGYDPEQMAAAARWQVSQGADIVDINMGCPAKKVCRKAAGSALLSDLATVEKILATVVAAVDVPVTLKTRTGPTPGERNLEQVADIAQEAGIKALAVHGRTRACKFSGHAEYQTIAAVRPHLDIPLIVNGDLNSPQEVSRALDISGADAAMIGRAAQGQPWIFAEMCRHLDGSTGFETPDLNTISTTVLQHVSDIHGFYGEFMGPRIARKHIGWYLDTLSLESARPSLMKQKTAGGQLALLAGVLEQFLSTHHEKRHLAASA